MKQIAFLLLIGVVYFFTTASSIIDKETKTNVSELSYKVDRLVQLEHAWNTENQKLLKEERDLLQRLSTRVDALAGHVASLKGRVDAIDLPKNTVIAPAPIALPAAPPVAPPVAQPVSPVVAPPAAAVVVTPAATPPNAVVAVPTSAIAASSVAPSAPVAPTAPATLPAPSVATAVAPSPPPSVQPTAPPPAVQPSPKLSPKPSSPPAASNMRTPTSPAVDRILSESNLRASPKKPAQMNEAMDFLPFIPYVVSGISLVLLTVLFIRMRRGEAELRRRLWRTDMDTLRDELVHERVQANAVNPKIHVTGELNKSRLP